MVELKLGHWSCKWDLSFSALWTQRRVHFAPDSTAAALERCVVGVVEQFADVEVVKYAVLAAQRVVVTGV